VGAADRCEIVFTRGTTEAINLVAQCMTASVGLGDEILVTEMEHHSNLVPWQMLCQRTGASLVAARVTPAGEIDLDDLYAKLGRRTRLLAVAHVSNALGTVNPVEELVQAAHEFGAWVLIDGAQAVQHVPIDVQQLGCETCHKSTATGRGPSLVGIYDKPVMLSNGQEVVVDSDYIRESILQPTAKIVAGYEPIMPVFEGQISEQSLLQIASYIKSLSESAK